MSKTLHSNCIIRLSANEEKGIEINVDFACFLSLDIERVWGDVANKFTLKLLDRSAYEVEAILLKGSRNIYVRYYVNDGDKTKYSKEFEGSVWNYSIDFINNMTILTIEGTLGVSVKDIYTVYNRFWNKFPYIDPELAEEIEKEGVMVGDILPDGAKTITGSSGTAHTGSGRHDKGKVNIKFRYAKDDNDEYKFQISYTDGNWHTCEMKCFPVRPSDIVKLIAQGGTYASLAPYNNGNIDFDSFVDSGFDFGTDDEGNKINWSTANEWKYYYYHPDTSISSMYNQVVTGNYEQYRQDYTWMDNIPDALKLLYGILLPAVAGDTPRQKARKDSHYNSVLYTLGTLYYYFNQIGNVEGAGWSLGLIEQTEPTCSDLSQIKMSNTRYINDVLLDKCISAYSYNKGKANYYLWFDSLNGKTRVNFRPADIEANPSVKVVVGQYYNSFKEKDEDNVYKGDMVLSYSYSSNTAAYIAGEEQNELAGINYTTGEVINVEGLSEKTKEALGVVESAYTDFNNGKIATLSGISSTNREDLVRKARTDWVKLAQTSFKAEVQILGNLNLSCGDYIEIVNLPGGAYGKHHTSGVYLIMGIKENISKGLYVSTLTLVKNAASSGAGKSSK